MFRILYIIKIISNKNRHLKHLKEFLKSTDVDLRINAGETIAFLYELAQCDSHSVYFYK